MQPKPMQHETHVSPTREERALLRRPRRFLGLCTSALAVLYAAISLALPHAPDASHAPAPPLRALASRAAGEAAALATAPAPASPAPPRGVAASSVLRVSEATYRCGEDAVRRDPLSPHRRDVAIRVALSNGSASAVDGRLRLRLSPGAVDVPCERLSIAPGRSQSVECWLPLARAPERPEVELLFDTTPPARVAEAPRTVPLTCVEAPPASQVVVRMKDQAGCDGRQGRGGSWRGRLAARSPRHGLAYCSYGWQGDGPPDLSSFRGEDWEVDEPVVVPLGGVPLADVSFVTDDRLGIAAAQHALEQLPPPRTGVRLAVLDTAALPIDELGRDDTNDHGRAVGLIARRVACGDADRAGACPVRVDNRLSLPIVAFEPRYTEDRERGGHLGTRAQLAAALHDLLDAWEAEGQSEPLVINLSLGWHGKHECAELGCGLPLHRDLPSALAVPRGLGLLRLEARADGSAPAATSSARAASEAVLLELVRARCLGALVLAAAGNAVGSDREGPLLPGAWNQLSFTPAGPPAGAAAARLAPECRGLVDPQRRDGKPATYGAPVGALLEAVGATAFSGQVLATTRAGALPRLNAYGAGITLGDGRPRALGDADEPGWLAPASGTSLATAIVSGAAARLWSQAGRGVAAHQIADQLHLDARRIPVVDVSGDERPAELFAGAGAPPAREVSACTVPNAFGVPCEIERAAAGISASDTNASSDPLPEICLVEPGAEASPGLCPVTRDPMHEPGESVTDCSGPACAPTAAAVDLYEAPWVMPQPWGISCATCSEFHEYFGAFTAYAIDLDVASPTFTGVGAASAARRPSIIGAAVRAGDVRSALALAEIQERLENGREQLRGRLYLDLWVPPSPASLIVELGTPVGALGVIAELETALLAVEAP